MCPSPAVAAVLLAVLVLANLAGSASAQNLLSSGGFEAPDVMWSNGKGIATYTFPALPSAVGWYIWHPFESGSIDQINCRTYPSNPRCNAPEGYQIIDINGNTHGGLCQWVFTPGAGAPCDVYFWYAPNTDGGPGVRSMQIGFTSGALGSVNFAYGLSSYTPWQWQLGRLRIVAPGSFATFCVYSTTYNTPFGTFLDNFQLYCSAPPEPSPSQTATWTPLPSQTRTSDPTKSNTASRTPDPSQTSTSSRTGTITRSPDPTPTNTRTGSKSQTASQTITPSNSETATHTVRETGQRTAGSLLLYTFVFQTLSLPPFPLPFHCSYFSRSKLPATRRRIRRRGRPAQLQPRPPAGAKLQRGPRQM